MISIELSGQLEETLRKSVIDLDAAAKEALLVTLYRQGKLSGPEVGKNLGVDRFELEAILHRHRVVEDLGTVDEYLEEVETLRKLLDEKN